MMVLYCILPSHPFSTLSNHFTYCESDQLVLRNDHLKAIIEDFWMQIDESFLSLEEDQYGIKAIKL